MKWLWKLRKFAELPYLFNILLQLVHWLMPLGNSRLIMNAGLWAPSLLIEHVRAHSTGLRTSTGEKEIQVRNLVHSMCYAKLDGRARAVCCRLMYTTRSNFYPAVADRNLMEFHPVPFRAGSVLALKFATICKPRWVIVRKSTMASTDASSWHRESDFDCSRRS